MPECGHDQLDFLIARDEVSNEQVDCDRTLLCRHGITTDRKLPTCICTPWEQLECGGAPRPFFRCKGSDPKE